MSPAPAEILGALRDRGQLGAAEAELASRVPVATDITVEADSGGHTDNRPLGVLLPVSIVLRLLLRTLLLPVLVLPLLLIAALVRRLVAGRRRLLLVAGGRLGPRRGRVPAGSGGLARGRPGGRRRRCGVRGRGRLLGVVR